MRNNLIVKIHKMIEKVRTRFWDVASCTYRQLLEQMDSMEIVNGQLIPALDKAGAAFEQGKLFLPQLIQAAGVAQAAFGEIRSYLTAHNAAPVNRGKVILATVKGDIHDIGKNIVKVLMENYGYQVIDLGRDVPPETIVAAALEHQVKLVGLSALMTTTLGAMEETIRQLHVNNVPCKVVVGGAVLTADYAAQIGADYYARDAKESVDIAKVMLMCLIHDIVEIDAGDTYAYDAENLKTQKAREDAAKERIFSILPEEQKEELIALFDEFDEFKTAESKFAHVMDNLQPLLLNNSNGGGDWREHGVTAEQVYGRQSKTKLGSQKLYEVTDKLLKEHISRGNILD